ncbi:MAG: hypothetical protein LBU60_04490 [Clostridiales bacterium]|jgi:uncharacterized membrane protein|nr:hypothetical protein [Clostridiales bacterium]
MTKQFKIKLSCVIGLLGLFCTIGLVLVILLLARVEHVAILPSLLATYILSGGFGVTAIFTLLSKVKEKQTKREDE